MCEKERQSPGCFSVRWLLVSWSIICCCPSHSHRTLLLLLFWGYLDVGNGNEYSKRMSLAGIFSQIDTNPRFNTSSLSTNHMLLWITCSQETRNYYKYVTLRSSTSPLMWKSESMWSLITASTISRIIVTYQREKQKCRNAMHLCFVLCSIVMGLWLESSCNFTIIPLGLLADHVFYEKSLNLMMLFYIVLSSY